MAPRAVVLRGDRALLVGEQGDERGVAKGLRDLSDEAAVGDDRVVDPDPVVAAGRDHHRLVELAHRVGNDLGGDRRVREVLVGGHALRLDQAAQRVALLDRFGGLDRLLAQVFELLAELLVLALRVEDVGRPAVGVFEGARDAVRGDLEWAEGARRGALDIVQAAVRGLAEVDGDHGKRREHEQADHEPPSQGAGRPRGVPGGDRAPDRRAQRGHPCAAGPRHGFGG